MTAYGLASYDALHAASAVAAGAKAIVTIDTGFALLPLTVLTSTPTAHGLPPAAASGHDEHGSPDGCVLSASQALGIQPEEQWRFD